MIVKKKIKKMQLPLDWNIIVIYGSGQIEDDFFLINTTEDGMTLKEFIIRVTIVVVFFAIYGIVGFIEAM